MSLRRSRRAALLHAGIAAGRQRAAADGLVARLRLAMAPAAEHRYVWADRSDMPALKAAIVRVVDESQPGWVECRFCDAHGREHVIVEKIPVVTNLDVTPDGPFPIPIAIECVVLERSPQLSLESGLTVSLARPWGVGSNVGLTQFDVRREQVVPCVFVSCADIDAAQPQTLLSALRELGCVVGHSPRQPSSGPDTRWSDWYARGLPQALARTDAFIAVIDEAWDSSSWMGEEAHQAFELDGARRGFFWNPRALRVRAMQQYLHAHLPDDPRAAVEQIVRETPV